jgi:RNA polymerase sigma-70 factor (ECF subfamily)
MMRTAKGGRVLSSSAVGPEEPVDYTTLSNDDLVGLTLRGEDQQAEAELARRPMQRDALLEQYLRQLFVFCRRKVGNTEDAFDLAQDVILHCVNPKCAPFDPCRGRFRAWLFTIAYNLCVDCLRRRGCGKGHHAPSRPEAPPVEELPGDEPTPDELLAAQEVAPQFWDCINSLSERERAVFLNRLTGLSNQETAQVISSTPNSVTVTLSHARANLRDCLHGHGYQLAGREQPGFRILMRFQNTHELLLCRE